MAPANVELLQPNRMRWRDIFSGLRKYFPAWTDLACTQQFPRNGKFILFAPRCFHVAMRPARLARRLLLHLSAAQRR
jgi:hypothetical protein